MRRRALDPIVALLGLAARLGSLALPATLVFPLPASAQESILLPLAADDPLELGTGWDADDHRARGESGACLGAAPVERHEGGPTIYTLLVLSRAGGRLLVGVHVGRTIASEGLRDARITDAARRLASRDRAEFTALCGSGFLAARALGGQYVGELAFDPDDARSASAKLRTGVWIEPAPFEAALAALLSEGRVRARELPDGRRSEALEIEPALLLRRALAFPETVTPDTARPFLGAIRPYPEAAFAGTEITIDPTLGWGDAARQVFLDDPTALSGSSAAVRAAEMRKALVQRRVASSEPVPAAPPSAASRVRDESAAVPAAAPRPAPAAAAPVLQSRMAALVYELPDGATVFATTRAPPGLYAEKVRQREYWIPGVATPDAAVRAKLALAAQAGPSRGTTIVVSEVGSTGVVMTDVAPAAGVHAVPAGPLQAWIAGVAAPTPAQREALAAAVQAAD